MKACRAALHCTARDGPSSPNPASSPPRTPTRPPSAPEPRAPHPHVTTRVSRSLSGCHAMPLLARAGLGRRTNTPTPVSKTRPPWLAWRPPRVNRPIRRRAPVSRHARVTRRGEPRARRTRTTLLWSLDGGGVSAQRARPAGLQPSGSLLLVLHAAEGASSAVRLVHTT